MGSVNLSQVTYGYTYVYVTASWDESPTVTIEVTGIDNKDNYGVTWRIRGRGSDTTVYLTDTSGQTGITRTFNAPDGVRDFAFQVYDREAGSDGNGSYTNGDFFTVEFSDDDSSSDGDDDDSGSGGSSSSSSGINYIHINQGEGTKVTVERTWSDYGPYTNSTYGQVFLYDGDPIYYPADRFVITAEALSGYEIDNYTFNGAAVPFELSNFTTSSSGRYKLLYNRDGTITTTAKKIGGDTEGDEGESDGETGTGGTITGGIVIDGITFPEIPADALSKYPYAVVCKVVLYTNGLNTLTSYVLMLSNSRFVVWDWDESAMESNYPEAVVSYGNGTTYSIASGDSAWTAGSDFSVEEAVFEIGEMSSETISTTISLVFANHDIYRTDDFDTTTGEYTKGRLYLTSCTDGADTHDFYIFKRSTIVAIADQARRLGGVTGELTASQMIDIFKSISNESV